MSYSTWTTYGFGVRVSDIKTTPEKLLKLASMNPAALDDIDIRFTELFDGEYKTEDLTMEDFEELEGDYCESGIAYVLNQVINEIPIEVADDFDGNWYILYCPTYPWRLQGNEIDLTEDKVEEIFKKYISVLTDEYVEIGYQEVENGG